MSSLESELNLWHQIKKIGAHSLKLTGQYTHHRIRSKLLGWTKRLCLLWSCGHSLKGAHSSFSRNFKKSLKHISWNTAMLTLHMQENTASSLMFTIYLHDLGCLQDTLPYFCILLGILYYSPESLASLVADASQ